MNVITTDALVSHINKVMTNMHFSILLVVLSICPLEVFLEKLNRAEELIRSVTSFGYPIESHQIETEDNYILTVFRIPHGRNTTSANNLPILLTHGMMGSAENYLWLGPERSLAYILADKGYDVWLMNCRGTGYSRQHKILNSNQKEFWDFSFHEIGMYDLPAAIDYILNATHQSSLYYVGHSQGCTTVFVMCSERPEYNDKLKLVIALAPGVIYKHFKQPLLSWLLHTVPLKQLEALAESMQLYQIPPPYFSDKDIRELATMLCVENKFLQKSCQAIFEMIAEVNVDHVDQVDIPSILSKLIETVSVRQAFHYGQLILSGNFQKYDYGSSINQQKYNSTSPPIYHLENVKFAAALFSGKGDNLVTPEDVKLLAKQLSNVVYYSNVPLRDFSHVDFIVNKNIENSVYKPILKLLERYK
ncbi:lipase 3-like [Diabrotica virgifera virgifera]|uniref:Lipase n=1 Tax=Diabrotica virgifera virgifera TaxID=50390 RepID=A0A6P7FQ97_DIAVI|nr:lipase 3-like [Diabrotica virgifera virgifera]